MSFVLPLFLLFALIAVIPALVIVATPAKAARAAVGWVIFVIGLIFIDFWTSSVNPYDDDGVGPDPSSLVLSVWVIVVIIAIGVRRDALFPTEAAPPRHPALCWSIPFGALASVAFVHWLRNRLAGAEPAAWVHGGVMAVFVLVILIAGWAAVRSVGRMVPSLRAVLAFAVVGLLLVSANVIMGFRLRQQAQEFAAGRPYCMMTYGGFETKRVARNGWEMSPLVNRHHGVWAVSKTLFLTVREKAGTRSYRYFNGDWRDVTHRTPDCRPVPG